MSELLDLEAINDALAAMIEHDERGDSPPFFYEVLPGAYRCRGCDVAARKFTRAVHEPGCLVAALERAQGLIE